MTLLVTAAQFSDLRDPLRINCGPVLVDFHAWLAGLVPRYVRSACSCGCQSQG